jgi:hypothetical protein
MACGLPLATSQPLRQHAQGPGYSLRRQFPGPGVAGGSGKAGSIVRGRSAVLTLLFGQA